MLLVVEIVLPMGEADWSRGWGTPSTARRRFVLSKKKGRRRDFDAVLSSLVSGRREDVGR